MKPVPLTIVLAIFILSSCASLPGIKPVSSVDTTFCGKPFATEQRQFVHTIFVTMPGGNNSVITGITTVFPAEASVHVIIMTLEGLVVFEGRADPKKTVIQRGFSFFSSTSFAAGLLNDVRLVFLKPAGVPVEIGRSEQGALVCRYRDFDRSILDVVINDHGDWNLVQYGADYYPNRRVSARYNGIHELLDKKVAPDRIELIVTGTGTFDYTLDMHLIQ